MTKFEIPTPDCGDNKFGIDTPDCKWMQDEICVNADCPICGDYCPVADIEFVCRYEDRSASNG